MFDITPIIVLLWTWVFYLIPVLPMAIIRNVPLQRLTYVAFLDPAFDDMEVQSAIQSLVDGTIIKIEIYGTCETSWTSGAGIYTYVLDTDGQFEDIANALNVKELVEGVNDQSDVLYNMYVNSTFVDFQLASGVAAVEFAAKYLDRFPVSAGQVVNFYAIRSAFDGTTQIAGQDHLVVEITQVIDGSKDRRYPPKYIAIGTTNDTTVYHNMSTPCAGYFTNIRITMTGANGRPGYFYWGKKLSDGTGLFPTAGEGEAILPDLNRGGILMKVVDASQAEIYSKQKIWVGEAEDISIIGTFASADAFIFTISATFIPKKGSVVTLRKKIISVDDPAYADNTTQNLQMIIGMFLTRVWGEIAAFGDTAAGIEILHFYLAKKNKAYSSSSSFAVQGEGLDAESLIEPITKLSKAQLGSVYVTTAASEGSVHPFMFDVNISVSAEDIILIDSEDIHGTDAVNKTIFINAEGVIRDQFWFEGGSFHEAVNVLNLNGEMTLS